MGYRSPRARKGVKTALSRPLSCSLFPLDPSLPPTLPSWQSHVLGLCAEKKKKETRWSEDEIQEIYAWMIIDRSILEDR